MRKSIITELLAEPQRFGFFQAVRLLLLWLEEQGVASQQAFDSHLRFRNSLALGFPASEVEALELEPTSGDAGGAPRFHLTPSFMGLLGAHGALPAHVTERIAAWQAAHKDARVSGIEAGLDADFDPDAPRAFLDMFSNRLLALFYGAWRKYRIEHAVAAPGDAFRPMLLALAGFGPGVPHEGVEERALALYAGVLRQRPASAVVLGAVLSHHFGVAVALEEGVGHWDRLAPGERTELGGEHAVLGIAAMLGERSWRPDLRVRVRIGPLDHRQFERFLPRGEGTAALRTLLGLFGAPLLSYEIVLVLKRDELRPIGLARGRQRLGEDSYLVTARPRTDRADMVYELRPMAPLAPLPHMPD